MTREIGAWFSCHGTPRTGHIGRTGVITGDWRRQGNSFRLGGGSHSEPENSTRRGDGAVSICRPTCVEEMRGKSPRAFVVSGLNPRPTADEDVIA
jgi:hypothetical protein